MILQEANAKDIEAQAKKEGLILMKQDGYLKVLEGETTIEEQLQNNLGSFLNAVLKGDEETAKKLAEGSNLVALTNND